MSGKLDERFIVSAFLTTELELH